MSNLSQRQPMIWPEGAFWQSPASLRILKGSTIDAITMANEANEPFRSAAAEAGIIIVSPKGENPGVVTVRKALWPQIRSAGTDGGLSSGPTGNPWVDSNGWLTRLTAAQNGPEAIWLSYSPPSGKLLQPADFALAVADAGAFGARWTIDLGKPIAEGIASENKEALACWNSIAGSLQFFSARKPQPEWITPAKLGIVVATASESRPAFGREVLNLASRRHLAYRILPEAQFPQAPLAGLTTLLALGTKPPQGETRERLLAFAKEGGLAIGPLGMAAGVSGLEPLAKEQPRFTRYRYGKGELAVAAANWDDPYQASADVHLLISRRQDVIRLWNAGAMIANYLVSPDGRKGELRLLNYTTRPGGDPVSVQLMHPFQSARLVTMERNGPTTLPVIRRGETIEIPLPGFGVYAGIELEA